ncbi:type VI secretion system baseplate subunit TssF [Donghicola sp. XS_ASV15]|uniref:type VI secretion system baseplate subunit TssF n=1 Tax=Donghicola sp. XS_ASV15 TaxID=3241295 RepID=UPI00351680DD
MNAFLQYYETELDYMRRSFEAFEKANPQQARALGISAGRSRDPDLQRIADSCALIAARLHQRLDNTRADISLDLLRLACPGFLFGAPSYATVAVDAGALEGSVTVPRGTAVYHDEDGKPQSRFAVARDVSVSPVRITGVRLESAPFSFALPEGTRRSDAALCLTVETVDGETPLAEVLGSSLEICVTADGRRNARLCNALAGGCVAAHVASGPSLKTLEPASLRPVIDVADTAHLPVFYTQTEGLEGLRDYLCYPDKGKFFALQSLFPQTPSAEIRIFLTAQSAASLSAPHDDDLALNIIPCLNLFETTSEPLRYDYARDRIPVSALKETSAPSTILRVDAVYELSADGERRLPEIFDAPHMAGTSSVRWQERHVVGELEPNRRELSFSVGADGARDLDFVAALYCSNGIHGERPRPGAPARIDLAGIADATFVSEPTVAIPPRLDASWQWDILSLVNGNFGAILEEHDAAASLRRVLHLCAPGGYTPCAEAIVDVTRTLGTAPVQIGRNVILAAGSLVEIVLDLDVLPVPEQIFARVLDRFLGSFVSYDRFIEVSIRARGDSAPLIRFPRRHGSQEAA